jgi:peptidoglycan/xylan/chitin deacetylase (PgdA/CDA1 family)
MEAQRTAVLTFDAAWSDDGAVEIMDTLRDHDVKATFFLAGRFVVRHPAIARRIVEDGHEVGNHTYHHGHLTRYAIDGTTATLPGVTAAALLSEMEKTRKAFIRATGHPLASLWRAPFGETNPEILSWTNTSGYRHVGWSRGLDSLDWVSDRQSHLYQPPGRAIRRILSALARRHPREGSAVILMHLGSTREPEDRFGKVLPRLIEGCRSLGYRLVTVGEALAAGRVP